MSSNEQVTTPAQTTPLPAEGYALPPAPAGPFSSGPIAGGTPEPPKPKQGRIKTAIIAAVAAVVLGIGGYAVANAVDSSNNSTSQNGGPGGGNFAGGPGGNNGNGMPGNGQFPGGGRGAGAGLTGALHGDFVASDGNGGYTTKRLATGTVSAVSSTSITVKSADGYTTTYAIGSSTTVNNGNSDVSSVKSGDTVTVVGTVSGSTATATTITDQTAN